jgi:peptidoglycan hydrolase-like protein with peptidoglycan-binding domain
MNEETKPFETGAIPSPHDYRDGYASEATAPTLAEQISLPANYKTQLAPPMNQAQIPACVSHSIVDNLKLYWFRKTGKWIDFSPRFLDTLVKRFDSLNRATDGTYPRLVMKLAVQYGCATTATLPNDTSLPVLQYRDDSKLTPEVFAEAAQYRIPGYVLVPNDVQITRQAIYLYGAISTLLQIGRELWTPSFADKDIDPLRTPNPIVDGHQMSPFGWEDQTYNDIQNEWSAAWANKGDAKYDPKAWAPFIIEQWAVAEIPPDIIDFLKSLPSPASFHYQWNVDLAYGDQNDDVKFAQIAYMILGFLAPIPATELGIFGPKTVAANAKYQQAHRIAPAPNHIGPQTRVALNAQFAI